MSELESFIGMPPLENRVLRLSNDSGVFSQEEVLAANARHDRYYGWSFLWPAIYSNNARLPETVVGKLDWA